MYDIFLKTKPLGAGDLFDCGQRLYRANFLVFFAIVLVVESAFFAVHKILNSMLVGQSGPQTLAESIERTGSYLLYAFSYALTAWVFSHLSVGALTWAAAQRMAGEEASVSAALGVVMRKLGRLLWTSLLSYLLIALGLVLFIIPAFYFFMWYLLSTQVVMLEDSWGWRAMQRSKQLMRAKSPGDTYAQSSVNRAAIIFVILMAIGVAVVSLSSLPAWAAGIYYSLQESRSFNPAVFFNPSQALKHLTLLSEIMGVFLNSLVIPLGTLAFVMLYFDIRVVKEGVDIQTALEKAPNL